MRLKSLLLLLPLLLALAACGPKPAMEGADQSSTEEGQVTDSSETGPTGAGDTTSFDEVEKVDEYTVVRGDNLWNIAAKPEVYRSGWLYPLILKANRSLISDAGQLKIGITLKIPRGMSSAEKEIAREEAMANTHEGGAPDAAKAAAEAKLQAEAAPPAAAATKPGAPARPKGGSSSLILIWLLLLAAAGAGAWWYLKMRAKPEQPSNPES